MLCRRYLILLVLLLLLPLSAGAAVYKWTDAEGNVNYSDVPQSRDAKPVVLPKTSRYSPREIETQRDERAQAERAALAVNQIAISQPADDATVRSNNGNVSVSVDLGAPLEDGRYWTLSIDGSQVGERQTTTAVTVQNLDRGRHQMQAQLFSSDGQRLGQSEPVTFQLRRESRLAPNRLPPPDDDDQGTPPNPGAGGGNVPVTGTSGSSGQPGVDAPQFRPNFAPR